jgi:hypothetical protein
VDLHDVRVLEARVRERFAAEAVDVASRSPT